MEEVEQLFVENTVGGSQETSDLEKAEARNTWCGGMD